MQYSKNGLILTEQFEGCILHSYQDAVGIWTIGYGHTSGVGPGMVCTQAQAEQWLLEDVQSAENAVNRLVTISLSQNEFDALVDFVFNLGEGNFGKSTLLKLLNANDLDAAANEFAKWDRAGGKVLAGLLQRRQQEAKLFQTPDVSA